MGCAGTFGHVVGEEFSAQMNQLFCDRSDTIMLQASLMGLDITECILRMSIVDGERSTMPVIAQQYIRNDAASTSSDDANTLHIITRNRKERNLTAMCFSGQSCLAKTFPPIPSLSLTDSATGQAVGPHAFWRTMQSEVARSC